ncbi:Rid family hydrolase [Roseobacter sp.]|uniref:Rid family hydrolase n=1 Tax=Roseobacter sp. TaxID=1907202 RepID=UPI0029665E62|nr:Rid family hydrolase [Roseobacter sp.]MDW3182940.1 Rid family hydrolase [Roseobacter sp.]
MTNPRALIPPRMASLEQDWQMSPGIVSNGHVFLTGFNGCPLDGPPSPDPETQITTAFDAVEMVLAEAGLGFADVIEMTSYHVGLADHLTLFKKLRGSRVSRPYPAWTAIEVAGFATPGVIVELKVVARLKSD